MAFIPPDRILSNNPTIVDSLNKVDFVGTPLHIYVTDNTAPFTFATLYLWIWSGDLQKPVGAYQNIKLYKELVSVQDKYILFEIGDYIKSFIEPSIVYGVNLQNSNEGVYYQYEVVLSNDHVQTPATRFATLGWNWNYEYEGSFSYNRGAFGFPSYDVPKFYNPYINYSTPSIALTATNSTNMVVRTPVTPPAKYVRCSQQPYLIIYLNKWGLWDDFTPNGKVLIASNIVKDTYKRTYRNPLSVDFSTNFEQIDFNVSVRQEYTINTGWLEEEMGELIEEIKYSPRVYLVEFKGDIQTSATQGITADNTIITADNTLITADNSTTAAGKYLTYNQIPVLSVDTDFPRKTRIDDKNKINYNLRFTVSRDKINSIR